MLLDDSVDECVLEVVIACVVDVKSVEEWTGVVVDVENCEVGVVVVEVL